MRRSRGALRRESVLSLSLTSPSGRSGPERRRGNADAEEMGASIRSEVRRLAGDEAASDVTVQYGGSATPENAAALLACADVDGLLVGGASLDAEKFCSIVRAGASKSSSRAKRRRARAGEAWSGGNGGSLLALEYAGRRGRPWPTRRKSFPC